jgi:DNA-binding NtrC family response regulator
VAGPRVCVIDRSESIRETVGIILGADFDVVCLAPETCLHSPGELAKAAVVIAETGVLPADLVADLLSNTALVWMHPGDTIAPGDDPRISLRRGFSPAELRSAVNRALSQAGSQRSAPLPRLLIDHPLLPHEASALARRAAQTTLPVLLCGESGTGKTRLAQAIHSLSSSPYFLPLAPGKCHAESLPERRDGDDLLTVFVNQLEGLTQDEQQFLLALLETGRVAAAAPPRRVRLIAATSLTYDRLAASADFDRKLFYRLSVLPIALPPLRDRTEDLPAIVATVAQQLGLQLGTAPASFTARAMQRLSRYLWFGNLAELETVLARTLALVSGRPLDAADLLFGYGPLIRGARPAASQPLADDATGTANSPVDLVINELAHEFKNPMVTIKTISQHLDRLLADEAGRQHVAQLTGEAVNRMDQALENLLQYTRFGPPNVSETALNTLLAPCVSELAPLLTERRVVLNYQPPGPIPVCLDAEQITYAIENLLRSVVRDLAEGETVSICGVESPPGFTVELKSGQPGVAERLARFLDAPTTPSEPALPLGLVFARTLIQRNGGSLDLHVNDSRAVVTVRLPAPEGITLRDGKTTNSHC